MSGWKLSAAIITKHFGVLGDTIAQALAAFDPETATEVDRDNLVAKMREIAVKMAEARQKFNTEQKQVDDLTALIAKDEKAAEVLIAKFEKGEIDEATLNEFAANLEDEKNRLPGEQQDLADAKELVDTLQDILNTIEKNLADFDSRAKAAQRNIAQAQAEQERQNLRLQNQAELNRLHAGMGASSTALNALNTKAEKMRVQADATKTLADIGQKPVDRANAVEEARRIAAGDAAPATESAADRLRRIAGK